MKNKLVSVIGLGYIGLPTAALVASKVTTVFGTDVNLDVVKKINQGKIHIVEPDLDILVHQVVKAGRLTASCSIKKADIYIIAVPTPLQENNQPDLSYIKSVANTLAPILKTGDLVILESTSPVGTTEKLSQWFSALRADLQFPHQHEACDVNIAYCPERVLPGKVLTELVQNDRIIGGITASCAKKAEYFYQQFVKGQCLLTNARTAEMAKLTENAYRDVNIAFANELSLIADKQGIDVWELIKLANHHPRVNILQPGCGVGGHCIAVDPWFIVTSSPKQATLIKCAREVNNSKPKYVVEKVKQAVAHLEKPSILCLGLAFKPDIDDLRESAAISIVEELANCSNFTIKVVEPYIDELPSRLLNKANVQLLNIDLPLPEVDGIIILVKHTVFYKLNLRVSSQVEKILDVCGLLTN